MPPKLQPLWKCPKCGERFITKNMWHSCGKFTLEELFARSEPHVITLFRKFEKMMRKCGPVTMIPQKTRVVFQVRVRFGGCYPRKSHLQCAIALPRVDDDPRFFKIEEFAPHFMVTTSVCIPKPISIKTSSGGCAKLTRSARKNI